MLAGKFAMAFVYCSLAWLDICILLFLHFCAKSIEAKVRTALVIDFFCACYLFCDLRAGTAVSLCVESSCSVRMFLALTESSTYRISACADFSVCRIFVICAPVLLHFLSLRLNLQGKGVTFEGVRLCSQKSCVGVSICSETEHSLTKQMLLYFSLFFVTPRYRFETVIY